MGIRIILLALMFALLIISVNAHVSPAGTFVVNKNYVISFVGEPKQAVVGRPVDYYVQVEKVTPLYDDKNMIPYEDTKTLLEMSYRPKPLFFYGYQKFPDVNTVYTLLSQNPKNNLASELQTDIYVNAIINVPNGVVGPMTYYTAQQISPGLYKFTHTYEEDGYHEVMIDIYDQTVNGAQPTKIFKEFRILVESKGPTNVFWGFVFISILGTFGAVTIEKIRGKK